MLLLVTGLVLFLGIHSVRLVSDGLRMRMIARLGVGGWKGLYSLISLAGLILIVIGYSQARLAPVPVWAPPVWTRHGAAVLMLIASVLLTAPYVPGNRIKAMVGHPMVLGVKVWALAHLLSNGFLADMILFGSFLLWAVLDFRSLRRRDGSPVAPTAGIFRDLLTVAVAVIVWISFALWLHRWLIGVAPFG